MNFSSGLLIAFAVNFGLLVLAMSVHEFAHALVAHKLGDTTAKDYGRLTLNPIAHIDFFWTLLLPFLIFLSSSGQFIFGAAKPVPVDTRAFKHPRRDMALVGLAGPLANFIFAFLLSLILKNFRFTPQFDYFLLQLTLINVLLGVFNLIPMPPLDGSRIILGLLPERIAQIYLRIEPFSFIILMLLIWLGAFNGIIWPLVTLILSLMGVVKG